MSTHTDLDLDQIKNAVHNGGVPQQFLHGPFQQPGVRA